MSKLILTNLGGVPAASAAGTVAVYSLADVLYTIDSSGTVTSLGGGGGGVTVAGVANQGIGVAGGPAYTLALSVTPQAAGTIIFRNGANTQWVGLGIGTVGQVLTVAGGVPTWAASGGGGVTVAATANQGIGVTGGPAYSLALSVPSQTTGTIIYRNAADTQWVGLNPGSNGEVLTLAGGVPTWAASGGGGVTVAAVANQGIAVTGGPAYTLALSVPSQAAGTLIYRNAADTQWVGLNPGSNGQVLTLAGGVPTWAASGGGGSVVVDAPLVGDGTGGDHVRLAPVGQANGDLLARTAGVWGSLPVGANTQVLTVVAGAPAWATPVGGTPPTDLYIAGTSGNDANDGLSVGTPVRTLNRVMQLVPTVISTFCTVHCAVEPITETVVTNWELPSSVGSAAKVLTIDAPVTTVQASTAITAGTQGSGFTFGNITHGAGFVPTVGQILVYETAGPNQGMYRILAAAPGAILIVGYFPAAPNGGDTFRVVTESVTINLAASTPGVTPSIRNGALLLSGVTLNFANNSTVMFDNVELFLNVAKLTGTPPGSSQVVTQSSRFYGMSSPFTAFGDLSPANVAPATTIGVQPYCGPWLDSPMFLGNRSSMTFMGGVLSRTVQGTQSSVTLASFVYTATGAVSVAEGSQADLSETLYFSGTTTPVVAIANNSVGRVSTFSFNTAVGLAMTVSNNSFVQVNAIIGTVGAVSAVEVRNHSRVVVPDANSGSNVVGSNPALAVIVGGNGGKSWAQIQAGAPTDTLDLASLAPTIAAVTTS